jgi:potassium-dependent mechanosensitive channel
MRSRPAAQNDSGPGSRVVVIGSALLVAAALVWGSGVAAQEPQTVPVQATPPPAPDVVEIASRQRLLADSAARAETEIAALASAPALRSDIAAARARVADLQALFTAMEGSGYARPERITRLRDQALLETQRLDGLYERGGERLEALGHWRAAWAARQWTWAAWQSALQEDPDFELIAEDFAQASNRIGEVQAAVAEALPSVLALQREIEAMRSETRQIDQRMVAVRESRRQELRRRGEPILGSPAYLAGLRDEARLDWGTSDALRPGAYAAFGRESGGLVVLHVALAVLLGVIATRLRRLTLPEGAWSGLLLRPWALGIFAATAVLAPRYSLAPPLWDVATWGLLAGSAAMLASRLLSARSLTLLVYYFAAVYPAVLLLEALRTPTPVFRPLLAGIAAGGALLFALRGRPGASVGATRATRWIVRGAAAVLAVIALAELAGYHQLARWIVHATATTALTLFVVALLLILARGAIHTLLRIEGTGRRRFLRTIAAPLAERLLLLLQAFLILGATLTVLDVWEIAPSPAATWNRIMGSGFTLAGVEITIGRILLAAVVIYLASTLSWFVRQAVDAEVRSSTRVDPAVGNSIGTLLHYALITLAVFIALGALGVELQNFAIVAGALGVGIGFGLQNVVNNFVSGLILLFERPVRVGDTVVVDEEWGTIKRIGLRSTVVLTFDRSELIVPNGDLVSEKVTNWTLSDPMARVIMPIGVAYGSDVTQVLDLLRASANAHPEVLFEPAPQALFTAFGDSALEFELRVWVRELRYRLEVKSAILAEVDRAFREAGIEIPFPQRDLHLRSIDQPLLDRMLEKDAS